VAGSDASKKSFGSGLRVRHSQKLIPNAVATKEADTSASTGFVLHLFSFANSILILLFCAH